MDRSDAGPEPGSFGALLRRYRQRANLTQEELAARARVSDRTVRNLEAGRVTPRFETARLLVAALPLMLPAARAVRGFLDALGVPPDRVPPDPDTQVGLYRSMLAGRRVLLVLDNARDADQVRPLLPGTPTALALVTSRNQLTPLVAIDGAEPLTLDALSPGEAGELLARRLGAERVAAELDAVDQIIAACARLPLALAIAAARAQQTRFPLAALAASLAAADRRLDALDAGDLATQMRAVLSWSYTTLTPPAARLFRLLGLHPGPDISAPAAASLAGSPRAETRSLLAELARANLVTEHAPGRYTLHDLLRAYAADLAHRIDLDEQRCAATHRLLDHYLHTAYTADRLLYPAKERIAIAPPEPGVIPEHPADQRHALEWLTTDHTVLLAAVHHAAATGFDTHAWQLAWTLATFLDRRGHWHDQAATGRAAVAAAERLADLPAQVHAHRTLAHAYIRLGRLDDAHTHLTRALDLATGAGDQTGQARTHQNLGYLWEQRGDLAQALHHGQRALELFRATGHQSGLALALNQVGWCHALLGDHRQALTACQEALTLHQDLGNHVGQAHTWDSLGFANHHLGRHTRAVICYHHAIDLYLDLGDRYSEAITLAHLGDTHHTTGNTTAAHATWQRALDILTDLDQPDTEQVRTKLKQLDYRPTSAHTPTPASPAAP